MPFPYDVDAVGVLGKAIAEAEFAQEAGTIDRVMCTEEAHRMYLASSFQFYGMEVQQQQRQTSGDHSNTASDSSPSLTRLYDVTPLGGGRPDFYSAQLPGILGSKRSSMASIDEHAS